MPNVPLLLSDETLPTIAENLACDEAVLAEVECGRLPGCLRLWEIADYAVVLGRSNRVDEEIDLAACTRDGVPVLRRSSGGGTVLLGRGCLVFTVAMQVEPEWHLRGIRSTTEDVLGRIVDQLLPHIPGLAMQGTSDLAVDGRKVSGNSQRWLRRSMMHHGTLLYDFDISAASHYLRMPPRQPGYRAGRSHAEFLTNLPLDRDQLRSALVEAFDARGGAMPVPAERIRELVEARYGRDDWNLGR